MDDLGLGKSVSALAAALRFGRFPVAIVVQAQVAASERRRTALKPLFVLELGKGWL